MLKGVENVLWEMGYMEVDIDIWHVDPEHETMLLGSAFVMLSS